VLRPGPGHRLPGAQPRVRDDGLLSLGHAAHFALGAYAGAFVFNVADLPSLEAYLLLGVIAATAAAAVAGTWCVRATRIHFTILTLAFAQLCSSTTRGSANGVGFVSPMAFSVGDAE